ncbi:Hsp70 family protein [Millisia brevis]|uniref:Hsp70 family protein n=1 Tax=Millisia brevis TaxID=264148 RepID=UPI0014717F4F|nr:Hsp70 family protein [Millisia brevis]
MARTSVSRVGAGGALTFDKREIDAVGQVPATLIGRAVSSVTEGQVPAPRVAVTHAVADDVGTVLSEVDPKVLPSVIPVLDTVASAEFVRASNLTSDMPGAVVVFDLGASGLTLSLVEIPSANVLGSSRTTEISGNAFDGLVLDHLVAEGILQRPETPEAAAEVARFCRGVKESLSTSTKAQTPGGGILLMTRDQLVAAMDPVLERAADLVGELGAANERTIDRIVLIGGGAYVPSVQTVLAGRLSLPVVVPDEPEMVVAKGAALIAGGFGHTEAEDVVAPESPPEPPDEDEPVFDMVGAEEKDRAEKSAAEKAAAEDLADTPEHVAGAAAVAAAAVAGGIGSDESTPAADSAEDGPAEVSDVEDSASDETVADSPDAAWSTVAEEAGVEAESESAEPTSLGDVVQVPAELADETAPTVEPTAEFDGAAEAVEVETEDTAVIEDEPAPGADGVDGAERDAADAADLVEEVAEDGAADGTVDEAVQDVEESVAEQSVVDRAADADAATEGDGTSEIPGEDSGAEAAVDEQTDATGAAEAAETVAEAATPAETAEVTPAGAAAETTPADPDAPDGAEATVDVDPTVDADPTDDTAATTGELPDAETASTDAGEEDSGAAGYVTPAAVGVATAAGVAAAEQRPDTDLTGIHPLTSARVDTAADLAAETSGDASARSVDGAGVGPESAATRVAGPPGDEPTIEVPAAMTRAVGRGIDGPTEPIGPDVRPNLSAVAAAVRQIDDRGAVDAAGVSDYYAPLADPVTGRSGNGQLLADPQTATASDTDPVASDAEAGKPIAGAQSRAARIKARLPMIAGLVASALAVGSVVLWGLSDPDFGASGDRFATDTEIGVTLVDGGAYGVAAVTLEPEFATL